MSDSEYDGDKLDFGPQPLIELLEHWGLSNHDLVACSPEQLTHKQVQKACKGRKLTLKMKQKVTRSLNFAVWGRLTDEERESYYEYLPKNLFSYSKGWDEKFVDPNAGLYSEIEGRKLRRDFEEELGL